MAKIAVELDRIQAGANGHAPLRPARRPLAAGNGWSVSDVLCTAGPHDRPFEEQLSDVSIAIVVAGSFQYRSGAGRELMTPGSLFLGNAGQCFECGHEHGVGDRCISFSYEPQCFEELAAEAGARNRSPRFLRLRVPPLRELTSLIARACAGLAESCRSAADSARRVFAADAQKLARTPSERSNDSNSGLTNWEEIGIELAARSLEIASGSGPKLESSLAAEARVTRVVRRIESRPDSEHALGELAGVAKLSRYHFLRVFQQLTGLTPHQYVLRTRLRRAATRLMLGTAHVLDIALDCGFGDVSNFNHAFRVEFGFSPGSYRRSARHR